jgi:hypothetical protein
MYWGRSYWNKTTEEVFPAIWGGYVWLGDGVNLSDAMTKAVVLVKLDGLSLSDAMTKAVVLIKLDGINLADTCVAGYIVYRQFSDGVNLSDALAHAAEFNRELIDGVSLADATAKSAWLVKLDELLLSDVLAHAAEFNRQLNDGASLADAIAKSAMLVKVDGLLLADAMTRSIVLVKLDGLLLSDVHVTSVRVSVLDGLRLSDVLDADQLPGLLIELQGQADDHGAPVVLNLVQGDTLPILIFWLTDVDGTPYDLDEATVRFRMRERNAPAGTYKVNAACMRLYTGLFQYQLLAADTDTAGEYLADLEMDFGGGLVYTTELFTVVIRADL